MSPFWCEIVVQGELSSRFDGMFAGMTLNAHDERTEMSGELPDQSALQGVLRQLFDIGLEVISVQSTSDSPG
jgi:hypothetical protein